MKAPEPLLTLDDPRVAPLRDLPRASAAEFVVVEGEAFVRRAVEAGCSLVTLLSVPTRREPCADLGTRAESWLEIDPAGIEALVGFRFHRGVLGVVRRPPCTGAWPLRQAWKAQRQFTAVVAERLSDPSNLGAMLRNAAALGADVVLCDAAGADPFSRRAVRASAGWVFGLELVVTTQIVETVLALKDMLPGAEIIAAVADPRASPLAAHRFAEHTIILLGNEGDGLSRRLVALADRCLTIEMCEGVDSLNVAAATAVLLWARHHQPRV